MCAGCATVHAAPERSSALWQRAGTADGGFGADADRHGWSGIGGCEGADADGGQGLCVVDADGGGGADVCGHGWRGAGCDGADGGDGHGGHELREAEAENTVGAEAAGSVSVGCV